MNRFVNLLILSAFLLWIIPLGAYIAPSQEKELCGGQRGICLCSHAENPSLRALGTLLLRAQGADQRDHTSSGGLGHDFLHFSNGPFDVDVTYSYQCQNVQCVLPLFYRSIEHVPKA